MRVLMTVVDSGAPPNGEDPMVAAAEAAVFVDSLV